MQRLLREIYAYARLVSIIALGLIVTVLIMQNVNRTAEVWIWRTVQVPTLWLMGGTGVAAICLYWTLSRIRRVLRDVREVRAERRRLQVEGQQRGMAEQLAEQERRIDAKLRRTLADEPPEGTAKSGEPPRGRSPFQKPPEP